MIAGLLTGQLQDRKNAAIDRAESRHLVSYRPITSTDPRFGWGASVLGQLKVWVEDLVPLWRIGERLAAMAAKYGLTVDVVEDVLCRAA